MLQIKKYMEMIKLFTNISITCDVFLNVDQNKRQASWPTQSPTLRSSFEKQNRLLRIQYHVQLLSFASTANIQRED